MLFNFSGGEPGDEANKIPYSGITLREILFANCLRVHSKENLEEIFVVQPMINYSSHMNTKICQIISCIATNPIFPLWEPLTPLSG